MTRAFSVVGAGWPDGMERGDSPKIVVVGQIVRDLVVCVDAVPEPGGSAAVRRRLEHPADRD